MNRIIFNHPKQLVFGPNSLIRLAEDFIMMGLKRLYIISVPEVMNHIVPVISFMQSKDIQIKVNTELKGEPSFHDFEKILKEAEDFNADCVAGIGGGSVMDVAKLTATFLYSGKDVRKFVGNGLIHDRKTHLACVPTTSGTGSEVSPNAILLDNSDGLKKGIISQFLVPDGAYIDPALTLDLPPFVTAYTALDALTHCIEAYANKNAHPLTDTFALEGIRLIGKSLKKTMDNGQDLEGRTNLALGSLYGGMCLGPVNTAAVHALAYPLGSTYKIAHGISNAVLLPYIMEFNLTAAEKRYSEIALALGAPKGNTYIETAENGIQLLREWIAYCKIPSCLSDLNIPFGAIETMAQSAITIQRLLKNNVAEVNLEDAVSIYKTAY